MHLNLIGVNQTTAPLAIREKVAVRAGELTDSLSRLHAAMPVGVILSTCNRTEIYTVGNGGCRDGKASLDFMKARANVPDSGLSPYLYTISGKAAAEHLFRIAGGLESLIIGEYEVLGQIRQSLEAAQHEGMVNLPLRLLFQNAIRIGRRIRHETGISQNALSVSSVAVALAADVVGDLTKCKMLVIGTGEAGRLVARAAREKGISGVVVAGRTRERAAALAGELGGIPISSKDLKEELPGVDLVITCSGAPHPVLAASHIAEAMKNRAGSPMVIIDIAMPRNVEPAASQIEGVFLFNMDDLTGISKLNRQQRAAEIRSAEDIIAGEVARFAAWWHDLEVGPVISALVNRTEETRLAQLAKVLNKLPALTPEQHKSLEAMTRSIVSRILEDPICYLKASENGEGSKIISEIFRLDTEGPP